MVHTGRLTLGSLDSDTGKIALIGAAARGKLAQACFIWQVSSYTKENGFGIIQKADLTLMQAQETMQ